MATEVDAELLDHLHLVFAAVRGRTAQRAPRIEEDRQGAVSFEALFPEARRDVLLLEGRRLAVAQRYPGSRAPHAHVVELSVQDEQDQTPGASGSLRLVI